MFRDQGRQGGVGDGKELCDLLVVFEDHIIIFSDKDRAFPQSGDLDLDWARWYRRALANSAKQVWGAERWIAEYPTRLFLDRADTQPFPLRLQETRARFHRIVVAHGITDACRNSAEPEALVVQQCRRKARARAQLSSIGSTVSHFFQYHIAETMGDLDDEPTEMSRYSAAAL
jgi:hypothetical protein